MAGIRAALSTLPARPVLVVAPLIVVLVLAFYYRDRHAKCTEMKQFRASLAASLAAVPSREAVRFADLTDFAWDRVRVVTGFVPRERGAECPFDWNWQGGERTALIDRGALTALIFALGDEVVAYRELDGSAIEIRGVATLLTPETAIFELTRDADGDVVLIHAEPRAALESPVGRAFRSTIRSVRRPDKWYTNGI